MPTSETLTTNAVSIPVDENQEGMPSWDQVARTFPERFPLSFRWTAVLFTLIVIGEQILEEYLVGPVEGYAFWQRLGVRFALPLLSIYLLLSNRFLKREVVNCLQLLKPSMQIPFEVYDRLARAMLKPRRLIEAVLLCIACVGVAGFLWFMLDVFIGRQ